MENPHSNIWVIALVLLCFCLLVFTLTCDPVIDWILKQYYKMQAKIALKRISKTFPNSASEDYEILNTIAGKIKCKKYG